MKEQNEAHSFEKTKTFQYYYCGEWINSTEIAYLKMINNNHHGRIIANGEIIEQTNGSPQDAAHSFPRWTMAKVFGQDVIMDDGCISSLSYEEICESLNELTRLRSELQQAKQEIANHIAVNSLLTDSDDEADLANKLFKATSELQQERARIRTLHQTLIARFYNEPGFNKDSLSKIIDEVGDLLK